MSSVFQRLSIVFLISLSFGLAEAQQVNSQSHSGLAPTPPMGWASWNRYFCDYDERTIIKQVDALVSSGLRDAGYKYVIIQECIAPSRDSRGELQPDPSRFPHGLKYLTQYIHDHGLLAGIYTDIGPYTCFANPKYQGSYEHEGQDARTFADWEFDLIEVDYCNKPSGKSGRELYQRIAAGIRESGRPMILYICSWGNEQPWEWAKGMAQVWRTDQDISWEKNHVSWGNVVANFESNALHSVFTAPDSWNDPDMLEVGMPGLSATESKSHFLMWAISAAPLWIGTDVTAMDSETRSLLGNREVIAVDQDPLGAGPVLVSRSALGVEVWSKALGSRTDGQQAVLLLNLSSVPVTAEVRWKELGLEADASVRDLVAQKDLGVYAESFATQLAPHGAALFRVSGKRSWQVPIRYEAEWPGNESVGNVHLQECGECSNGYAMVMAAQNDQGESSLTYRHIDVQKEGEYRITLLYARTAAQSSSIKIVINDGKDLILPLPQRAYGWLSFFVHLHSGENNIHIHYADKGSVYLDALELAR